MKRSKGQIMPVTLFGTALVGLTMLAVFNTSQLSSKKQRLNNAADAAAYSAAVLQARSLNAVAYSNRAMVANQVFIGQMVTLENYLNYWNVKTRNLSYVPYVNVVTAPLNSVVQSIQTTTEYLTGTAVQASLATNTALSIAQRAIATTGGVGLLDTATTVVEANDPDIEITLHGAVWLADAERNWRNNLARKHRAEELIAKGEIIQASRDRFTAERDYSQTIVPPLVSVRKRGTTDLNWEVDGTDVTFRWDAIDVLSLKINPIDGGLFGGDPERIPIGWSKRFISGDNSEEYCNGSHTPIPDLTRNCYNRFGKDQRSAVTAGLILENEGLQQDYSELTGLNYQLMDYYELSDGAGLDPRFPVAISVAYKDEDVKTSEQLPDLGSPNPKSGSSELNSGVFYQESATIGDTIESVAKAEVYFRRPVSRDDGQDEFANVWNPYWSARLVEPAAEREQAQILKLGRTLQ